MGNQAVDHLRPRLYPTYWPQSSVSLGEQPGSMSPRSLLSSQQPLGLERPMQNNIGPQPAKRDLSAVWPEPARGWGHAYSGSASGTAQGVLAKNPQLRHLSPQQQQQLHALLMQRQLQQSQAARQAHPTRSLGPQPSPLQGLLGSQPQPGGFPGSQTGPLQELGAGLRPQEPTPTPTHKEPYPQDQFLALSIPHLHPSSPQEPKRPSSQLPSPVPAPLRGPALSPSQEPQAPGASLGLPPGRGLTCCCPACGYLLWQGTGALGPPRPPSGSPEAGAKQPGTWASGPGEWAGGT